MSHVQSEFIPLTIAETRKLGWDEIDILLITGDVYVDHPSYGIAIIGRLLLDAGYRVAMIAQPDWKDPESLKTFGRPRIACAITSGNMDSMVNIYTAGRRFRREDAYSINGETGKRPPHALTVYTQLAKQAFPKIPVQVGGLEASLRRVAHYDYWQDKIRPSVLVDSKADILVFGQGEKPVLEIYRRLAAGESLEGIRGTARLLGKNAAEAFDASDYVEIPSYEEHLNNRDALMTSTVIVEREMNPWCGKGLVQRYDQRLLVIEPSPEPMSTEESDHVHSLPFKYLPHPIYKGQNIPAFETIKNSIPAVRGCPGGCAFCGLVSHQGRHMTFRSEESIVNEVERLKKLAHFRGTISDIGGPAGNIYGNVPFDVEKCHSCKRSSCLYPKVCKNYNADGTRLIKLLRRVRSIDGVKHLHINSGVRLELALLHKELSRELIHHHVSGHLKVAPEHLHPNVTALMRKDPPESFLKFKKIFEEESASVGKEQYLIPLFISNFPGCTESDMKVVDDYLSQNNWSPQQVQDYIPLPMTMGAAMYYTGKNEKGELIHVNRGLKERRPQIDALKRKRREHHKPQRKKRFNQDSRGR
jgi:uncharacterized radical SAM protein YgiQ